MPAVGRNDDNDDDDDDDNDDDDNDDDDDDSDGDDDSDDDDDTHDDETRTRTRTMMTTTTTTTRTTTAAAATKTTTRRRWATTALHVRAGERGSDAWSSEAQSHVTFGDGLGVRVDLGLLEPPRSLLSSIIIEPLQRRLAAKVRHPEVRVRVLGLLLVGLGAVHLVGCAVAVRHDGVNLRWARPWPTIPYSRSRRGS